MGLFDGYYDPSTYQGGGGMIDRLMAQLQTQSQYQPAQGFPASPMNAQAAMPVQSAPQNDPIAVGNYQMPRIGSGFPEDTTPQSMVQPANYSVPQPQLPPQLQQPGTGTADHITAGLNSFAGNLHHGLIGSILSGINGFATGQRNDPAGLAQQTVRQTYQALIAAGIPEPKARLAAINPEYGKAIMADALGKQYGFTTLPDGTVLRTDPRDGSASPVYSGGAKPTFGVINEEDGKKTYGFTDPSRRTVTPYQPAGAPTEDRGTVSGPDGKPIPIPPGVDRKTFVNEISKSTADALTGKKTEVQAKSEKFGNQMELAERNIKGLENEYTSTIGAGGFFRGTEYLPGGNTLQSESYQKFRQARDSFLTALLRDESGAAIGSAEFNRREKEMFPQPGDGEETVKRKAKLRAVAIEGMKKAAGPGYKSPDFAGEETAKANIDALLKKYGGQ